MTGHRRLMIGFSPARRGDREEDRGVGLHEAVGTAAHAARRGPERGGDSGGNGTGRRAVSEREETRLVERLCPRNNVSAGRFAPNIRPAGAGTQARETAGCEAPWRRAHGQFQNEARPFTGQVPAYCHGGAIPRPAVRKQLSPSLTTCSNLREEKRGQPMTEQQKQRLNPPAAFSRARPKTQCATQDRLDKLLILLGRSCIFVRTILG